MVILKRNRGSPANSRGLAQIFSVLFSAILSIKRRFLLHFLKKVHKNVGSRTYQSALALLTSRCYACDILRSLRALPLTTGRNAWVWHDSLRSNMYHTFPAHCSVAPCVAPRCPLYNEITHARHNANKFAFYSCLIVIFAFSDELPSCCTAQAEVI